MYGLDDDENFWGAQMGRRVAGYEFSGVTSASQAQTKAAEKDAIQLSFEQQEFEILVGNLNGTKPTGTVLGIFGNGTWMKCTNDIGVFVRQKDHQKTPALPYGPAGSFESKLPKIPKSIMALQVSFYREVMKKHQRAEAFSIILFNKTKQEYFLHIPAQRVSKGGVSYNQQTLRELFPSDKFVEVMSCHSHNDMAAYFSGVDDRDEQGDMLYMVHGTLHNATPTLNIRANLRGTQCCFVPYTTLFSMTEEEFTAESPSWHEIHPAEWMNQINVEADYSTPLQSVGRSQSSVPTRFVSRGENGQQMIFADWESWQRERMRGARSGSFDGRGNRSLPNPAVARGLVERAQKTPEFFMAMATYDKVSATHQDTIFLLFQELLARGYLEEIVETLDENPIVKAIEERGYRVVIEQVKPTKKKPERSAPALEEEVFTGNWDLGSSKKDESPFFTPGLDTPVAPAASTSTPTQMAIFPRATDRLPLTPVDRISLTPVSSSPPATLPVLPIPAESESDLSEPEKTVNGSLDEITRREESFLQELASLDHDSNCTCGYCLMS